MEGRITTRPKTVRLTLDTLGMLREAAKHAKVTESSIVNEVVSRRLLVDPLIPRFRYISLDAGTMTSLLTAANADVLETAASELALRDFPVARRLYKARKRSLEFRELFTVILADVGQWFQVEEDDSESRTLLLSHPYGLNWSRYVKSFAQSAYRTLSRDSLKIEIDDQFIQMQFLSS